MDACTVKVPQVSTTKIWFTVQHLLGDILFNSLYWIYCPTYLGKTWELEKCDKMTEIWEVIFKNAVLVYFPFRQCQSHKRRRGAVDSASDLWSVDTCQLWVRAPSKAPAVSLSKKLYSHCLVLVGSRNGFKRDLHKQIIACFTIELKQISINYKLMPKSNILLLLLLKKYLWSELFLLICFDNIVWLIINKYKTRGFFVTCLDFDRGSNT